MAKEQAWQAPTPAAILRVTVGTATVVRTLYGACSRTRYDAEKLAVKHRAEQLDQTPQRPRLEQNVYGYADDLRG